MSEKVKKAIKECYDADFFGDMCMPCKNFMECVKLSIGMRKDDD